MHPYNILLEDTQQNWYIKWRAKNIESIKNTTDQFIAYSTEQINNNSPWLEKYRNVILDHNKYPVKTGTRIQKAPDYPQAIQRISRPMSNSFAGLRLDRIEIPDDKATTTEAADPPNPNGNTINNITNQNITQRPTNIQRSNIAPNPANRPTNNSVKDTDPDNAWFKKLFVPTYDGRDSFPEEAKRYFYGADNRSDLNAQEIQKMLDITFRFCAGYNTTSRSINNDLHGIINFLNQNPITGTVENPTNNDLEKMMNAQGNGGKASTNPVNNMINTPQQVNADTDYNLFMQEYFSDILNEVDGTEQVRPTGRVHAVYHSNQADRANAVKTNTGTYRVDTTTNPQSINNNNNPTDNVEDFKVNPNKLAKANDSLQAKRKQIAYGIVEDAFTAKLTCMGYLYRDFMNMMQNHVSSYFGDTTNQ